MVESMAVHFRFEPVVSVNVAMAKSTLVNCMPISSLVPASPGYPAKALTPAIPNIRDVVDTSAQVFVVRLYTLTVRVDFS